MSSSGLDITWRALATTPNEAAVDLLLLALDHSRDEIAIGALRALLARRSLRGTLEVVRRWDRLSLRWKEIVAEQPDCLSHALRQAVVGETGPMCVNACHATIWLREYDLAPLLINVAESSSHAHGGLAGHTLLRLAELLHDELAAGRKGARRGDPYIVRTRVVTALEKSLARWAQHQRLEILESFLILAPRDNALLRQILNNPHDPTYLKVIDLLAHSRQPGVMRLLLGYLDDRRAPTAALQSLARRGDRTFVTRLLKKVGYEPSAAARRNLRLIRDFPWLRNDFERIDGLDDAAQHAAAQVAVFSSMQRRDVLMLLERLLRQGKPGGRRAAAAALRHFQGVEANQLVLEALQDQDPLVQVAALERVRQRGLPGAMARLLELLESEHETVRSAVRKCLSEFSCSRFLAAFDLLTPEARQSTGSLVRKVDLTTLSTLREELASTVRNRRFRAVEAAEAMGLVAELEASLLDLLRTDDHLLRAKAAHALRHCDTDRTRHALRECLLDDHPNVQEAAEASLLHLRQGNSAAPSGPPVVPWDASAFLTSLAELES